MVEADVVQTPTYINIPKKGIIINIIKILKKMFVTEMCFDQYYVFKIKP